MLTHATGTAERDAAAQMLHRKWKRNRRWAKSKRLSVGADKAYDTRGFVKQMRRMGVRPHVTQNHARSGGSAIDGRTTRHEGYAISQQKRQQAERVHAWPKTWSTMRRAMVRGLARMKAQYQLALTGGNLMRLVKLTG